MVAALFAIVAVIVFKPSHRKSNQLVSLASGLAGNRAGWLLWQQQRVAGSESDHSLPGLAPVLPIGAGLPGKITAQGWRLRHRVSDASAASALEL